MSISFECPFPFVFTRRQQKKTTVSTAEYMFSYQYSPPHGDHCFKCYLRKLTIAIMHAQNKTLEQHGSFLVISKLICLKIVINWPTAMIPVSLNKFSKGCALLIWQHLKFKNSRAEQFNFSLKHLHSVSASTLYSGSKLIEPLLQITSKIFLICCQLLSFL